MALNQESQLVLSDNQDSLLTKLPDNFEERMGQRLNGTDVRHVSRAFEFCHIMDWKQFGEDFLQLPLADTENIREDIRTRPGRIHAIFQKWLEKSGEKGTISNMISLLKEAKLEGILQRWIQQYKASSEKEIERIHTQYRKGLRQILEVKRFINWKRFSEDLKIDDKLLDVEEKYVTKIDQQLELLHMYHDRFGFSSEVRTKLNKKLLHSQSLRDVSNTVGNHDYYGKRKKFDGKFTLVPMTGNSKRCQGCEKLFEDKPSKNGLLIKHWEKRFFTTKAGKIMSKLGNAYYHNDEECVSKKYDAFKMSDLDVSG